MSERERDEEGGRVRKKERGRGERVRTALRKEGREEEERHGDREGGGAQLCRCIVQRRERVLGDK